MVFCCFDPLSPEEQLTSNEIVSSRKEQSRSAPVANETIVSFITIPPGVSGGQMLRIKSPDGSRQVEAQVPDGMEAGQTFLVKIPDDGSQILRAESMKPPEEKSGLMQKLDKWLTPTPDPDVYQAIPVEESKPKSKKWTVAAKPLQQVMGEPVQATVTRAQVRESPSLADSTQATQASNTEKLSFTKSLDKWLTPTPDPDVVPKANTKAKEQREAPEERDPQETSYTEEQLSLAKSLEDWLTPSPDPDVVPPNQKSASKSDPEVDIRDMVQPTSKESRELHEDSNLEKSPSFTKSIEDWLTPTPDPDVVPPKERSAPEPDPQTAPKATPHPKQELLLVHVPPGMVAGTTMYVEVPNENRTLAVQVPPDARSFHVAYTPRGPRIAPPTQARGSVVPRQTAPSQKLLLVRIPPGTKAGTTLHVSVPDEPGRILAAKVPSGNVKEFHVTYKPRIKHGENRSMLNPTSAYSDGDSEGYHF